MKMQINRDITLVAIILITLILIIVVINSYQRQYHFFSDKFKYHFVETVREYNMVCPSLKGGLVSAENNSTVVIVRDWVAISCGVYTTIDIGVNTNRAIYDTRDLERWKLGQLAEILEQKFEYKMIPFVLILTDSIGNRLDYYAKGKDGSLSDESYSVPMGFWDGYRLTVYYSFPWKYFCMLEWKYMLVIVGVGFLLGSCIFMLFRLIGQNKKRIENLELFVRALNHDLKSPVNDLRMKLYLIQRESVVPFTLRQQELYTLARTKTEKLLVAIDKLLQDSVECEGLRLNVKELEMNIFMQQLTEDWLRSVTGQKPIKLKLKLEMADTLIRVDAHHLSRAIRNLLENALKYSDDQVEINMTCKRIGRYVEISVRDNGQGIDKSELKNVFNRNYRIGKGKDGKVKGYGLGLSYVKMIVRAHGGKVWVESEYGKGCNFVIRLKA